MKKTRRRRRRKHRRKNVEDNDDEEESLNPFNYFLDQIKTGFLNGIGLGEYKIPDHVTTEVNLDVNDPNVLDGMDRSRMNISEPDPLSHLNFNHLWDNIVKYDVPFFELRQRVRKLEEKAQNVEKEFDKKSKNNRALNASKRINEFELKKRVQDIINNAPILQDVPIKTGGSGIFDSDNLVLENEIIESDSITPENFNVGGKSWSSKFNELSEAFEGYKTLYRGILGEKIDDPNLAETAKQLSAIVNAFTENKQGFYQGLGNAIPNFIDAIEGKGDEFQNIAEGIGNVAGGVLGSALGGTAGSMIGSQIIGSAFKSGAEDLQGILRGEAKTDASLMSWLTPTGLLRNFLTNIGILKTKDGKGAINIPLFGSFVKTEKGLEKVEDYNIRKSAYFDGLKRVADFKTIQEIITSGMRENRYDDVIEEKPAEQKILYDYKGY